ncbi:hypothetical protein G6F22_021937 [Rhizopus arrhizus]|nr:hypothetical protein G6F22_021937 [Rhizopus arrhizus]
MMGSGVFLLPSSLAKIGTASIWGWLITTAGAFCWPSCSPSWASWHRRRVVLMPTRVTGSGRTWASRPTPSTGSPTGSVMSPFRSPRWGTSATSSRSCPNRWCAASRCWCWYGR